MRKLVGFAAMSVALMGCSGLVETPDYTGSPAEQRATIFKEHAHMARKTRALMFRMEKNCGPEASTAECCAYLSDRGTRADVWRYQVQNDALSDATSAAWEHGIFDPNSMSQKESEQYEKMKSERRRLFDDFEAVWAKVNKPSC